MNGGVGPPGYHEHHYGERDWRFYRGLVAQLVTHAEPGPVLDIGAGCGFLVEAATRWGLDCRGVEGSAEAIDLAAGRCAGLRITRHLISDPLPFPDAGFQTAVMNQVIEHLDPALALHALDEAFRVLRPGGLLLVFSPNRHNKKERDADPTHVRLYTPGELRELLEGRGFVGLRALDTPLPWLGKGRIGRGAMLALHGLTGWDRLSATANSVAYRPADRPR